jgi:acetate---CoA ligase (ADP-forming)
VPPPVSIPALPGARGAAAVLPEAQVKAWLAAAGLPVPRSELVRSAADAVAASAAIGYPVVVKVQAAALPHKGDAGVLALRLGSAPEVRAAYDEVWARAVALIGADGIDGVLVEQMVPAGFEMLVGITRDPLLGPFLTVGAGGSLTEIFHDVVALPAPASPEQVRAAVFRLRCAGAFDRGARAPLDLAAFCDLAATISAIAAQTPELAELDLNPVIVHQAGGGADIADALAVRT